MILVILICNAVVGVWQVSFTCFFFFYLYIIDLKNKTCIYKSKTLIIWPLMGLKRIGLNNGGGLSNEL